MCMADVMTGSATGVTVVPVWVAVGGIAVTVDGGICFSVGATTEVGTGADEAACAAAAAALSETSSNLFSSSCAIMALAGMGGIPMDKPGGGRAGDGAVASIVEVAVVAGSAPKDPKPKSRLSSSPAVVSQCPILRTFVRVLAVVDLGTVFDTTTGVGCALLVADVVVVVVDDDAVTVGSVVFVVVPGAADATGVDVLGLVTAGPTIGLVLGPADCDGGGGGGVTIVCSVAATTVFQALGCG